MIRREIPHTVSNEEVLIRVIFHPLFYSKSGNKLKTNAFLPPYEKTDVSIYRLDYSHADACKKLARKIEIPNQAYCGIAVIRNSVLLTIDSQTDDISFEAKGTPIDENNHYRPLDEIAYTTDAGAPMHGDIVYNAPLRKGQPNIHFQEVAKEILEHIKYYPDVEVENEHWTGAELRPLEESSDEDLKSAA